MASFRSLDALGYGPEDYYVFVYGCVSGPCENPSSKEFGEFEALLREEYNAWAAEAEYQNKRYGEDLLPSWETWRKTHLVGVPAPSLAQGEQNLRAALANIPGNADIHLWGHSAGGGAILSYLTSPLYSGSTSTIDPRIASVALIDPYLFSGDVRAAGGGVWLLPNERLDSYLYSHTRVRPGALLQVKVDWSIVSDYQWCVDGFDCRTADYSKSNPAGKPGPAFPILDTFNKDYRIAWHRYSFFVVYNTNFENWFRQYWK